MNDTAKSIYEVIVENKYFYNNVSTVHIRAIAEAIAAKFPVDEERKSLIKLGEQLLEVEKKKVELALEKERGKGPVFAVRQYKRNEAIALLLKMVRNAETLAEWQCTVLQVDANIDEACSKLKEKIRVLEVEKKELELELIESRSETHQFRKTLTKVWNDLKALRGCNLLNHAHGFESIMKTFPVDKL